MLRQMIMAYVEVKSILNVSLFINFLLSAVIKSLKIRSRAVWESLVCTDVPGIRDKRRIALAGKTGVW